MGSTPAELVTDVQLLRSWLAVGFFLLQRFNSCGVGYRRSTPSELVGGMCFLVRDVQHLRSWWAANWFFYIGSTPSELVGGWLFLCKRIIPYWLIKFCRLSFINISGCLRRRHLDPEGVYVYFLKDLSPHDPLEIIRLYNKVS